MLLLNLDLIVAINSVSVNVGGILLYGSRKIPLFPSSIQDPELRSCRENETEIKVMTENRDDSKHCGRDCKIPKEIICCNIAS